MFPVGPDGHTASLFPGHPLLEVADRWVAHIEDSPKLPPKRITLTYPVLNASKNVFFVCTGAGKSDNLAIALGAAEGTVPAGEVKPTSGSLVWFVDDDASAGYWEKSAARGVAAAGTAAAAAATAEPEPEAEVAADAAAAAEPEPEPEPELESGAAALVLDAEQEPQAAPAFGDISRWQVETPWLARTLVSTPRAGDDGLSCALARVEASIITASAEKDKVKSLVKRGLAAYVPKECLAEITRKTEKVKKERMKEGTTFIEKYVVDAVCCRICMPAIDRSLE